jgi:trk system potassium uptake protein TrkH
MTNYKVIAKILGVIILIVGIGEIIPWIYAEVTEDVLTAAAFRICAPVTIGLGFALSFFIRADKKKFGAREGFLVVACCWIVASLIGAFPYLMSGVADNYIDAFFESTTGFTTTGCSTIVGGLTNRSIILWKAISHWLGGMGILIFVISLLPALGVSGQIIARAEAPGPVLQKTRVRMSDSAKVLYLIYSTFTVAEFILLALSKKMSVYDAVITTLGSVSTSGTLVPTEGIAYYDSLYVELVVGFFCIMASVNFVLYHYVTTGKPGYLIRDAEFRAYIIIIASAVAICTFGLVTVNGEPWTEALRNSFFQVASFASTTGYTITPYLGWPAACQMVLFTIMFIGGCAASTAGSLKVIRVLVLLKMIGRGCVRRIHPRSVVAVKIGKSAIPAPVVSNITVFIFTFIGILLLSTLIISIQGLDLETSLTSSLGLLSNTGAAFGEAASLGHFSFFHPAIKLWLSFLMIVGRLELFTVIILFTRNFWGKNK